MLRTFKCVHIFVQTKRAQVFCKASLLVGFFISPYYLLAIFRRKCKDSLLLCHVYVVALFFSLDGAYVVRYSQHKCHL